ncbi:hypothetical protein OnM2_008004 [Erysiphe neolycopersici]|uniref:Mid2 domain-containing protein n=1 Tax=Erysiphe neolycopersici TaxID=212602 RepID=A0A420I700_9PEZI|nr:hypothetical protein OnM2_008004 [Erysiphe neolycopersici]
MKFYQQLPTSGSSSSFSFLLTITLYLSFNPTVISDSLQDPCPIFNQLPCGSGTPLGFCCSQGQKCIQVAGNTTAICCPSGKACSSIVPISCNIQKQNVTANPFSAIKTIALNSSMIKCGTKCCPFGFFCNSQDMCIMNADQSPVPSLFIPPIVIPPSITTASAILFSPQATTLSTTTPSTTLPTTLSTTSSVSITTSVTLPVPAERSKQKLSPIAILVGLFPGLVSGILLVVALLYFRKIYKKRKKETNATRPFIKHISAPKLIHDVRTDFLRMHVPQNSTVFTEASHSEKNGSFSQDISIFKIPSQSNLDLDEALKTPLPPPPLNIRKHAPMMPLDQSYEIDSEYRNRLLTVSYSSERTPIMRPASVRDFRYCPEDFEDYRSSSILLVDKSRN